MKPKPNQFLRSSLPAVAAALALGTTAHATVYTWDGGTNTWDSTNWNSGAAAGPTANTDTATINGGQVTINGQTIDSAIFIGSGATVAAFADSSIGLNVNLNGNLTGSGTLTKTGNYSLLMQGNNSGFSGTVNATNSHVFFQADSAGSAAADWTITGGAKILNNQSGTGHVIALGSLAGDSTGYLGGNSSGSAVTFEIGGKGSSTSFAGQIVDTPPGYGGGTTALKIVGGTLTLTGANNYTGATTINAGTLQIGNGGTTGTLGSGNVTIASGATLEINRSNDYTPSGGQTFSGAGTLVKNGSGNITFAGSSVVSGLQNLVVNDGTVRTDNYAQWKSDLNLTVSGTGVFEMWNTTTSIGNLSGNGTIKNSANYSGYYGGATYATNNLTIAAGNFSGTITDNGIGDGGNTSGPLGDTRINLIKSGTGTTLTLSGNNTYGGSTTVNGGTLLATKAAALPGYNAASRVSVANGATLAVRAGGAGEWSSGEIDSVLGATTNAFDSGSNLGIDVTTGNSFSYANDIGATQTAKGLVKSGAGTLTLTGANSYTGTTAVNVGTLQIGNSGATGTLGSGNVTIASGANLTFNRSDNFGTGSSQVFSGAGTITKEGAGELIFNGANDHTNVQGVSNVVVNNGLIRTDNYGQWNSNLNLTVNGPGKFEMWNTDVSLGTLNGNGTVQNTKHWGHDTQTLTVAAGSFSGTITDLGITSGGAGTGDTRINLVKNTAGTLTLSGTNDYHGTTTVSGGKLVVNGNNSAATGALTVKSGGTLGGSGTVGGATTIESGGHLAVGNSAGTQTFSSTLTFDSGSIFDWELNAETSDPGANTANSGTYDKVVANGNVTGTSAFTIALGTNAFTNAFWDTNKSWSDIFTGSGSFDLSTLFTTFGGTGVASNGLVTGQGQFSFTSTTLNWTAVPEPTSALAGLLITAGLLRRRRAVG